MNLTLNDFRKFAKKSNVIVVGYLRALLSECDANQQFSYGFIASEVQMFNNVQIKIQDYFSIIGIYIHENAIYNPEFYKVYKAVDLDYSTLCLIQSLDLKYYFFDANYDQEIIDRYFADIIYNTYANPSPYLSTIYGIFYDNFEDSNHIHIVVDIKCHADNNLENVMQFAYTHNKTETKAKTETINDGQNQSQSQTLTHDSNVLEERMIKLVIYDIVQGLAHLHSQNIAYEKLTKSQILCHFHLEYNQLLLLSIGMYCDGKYSNNKNTHGTNNGQNTHNNNNNFSINRNNNRNNNFSQKSFYTAPETLHTGVVSMASDIWLLGILCHELALGYPLFGDTLQGIKAMFKIGSLAGKTESITIPAEKAVAYSLSDLFCDFIGKCLIPAPELRYTCQQLFAHPWFLELNNGRAQQPQNVISSTSMLHSSSASSVSSMSSESSSSVMRHWRHKTRVVMNATEVGLRTEWKNWLKKYQIKTIKHRETKNFITQSQGPSFYQQQSWMNFQELHGSNLTADVLNQKLGLFSPSLFGQQKKGGGGGSNLNIISPSMLLPSYSGQSSVSYAEESLSSATNTATSATNANSFIYAIDGARAQLALEHIVSQNVLDEDDYNTHAVVGHHASNDEDEKENVNENYGVVEDGNNTAGTAAEILSSPETPTPTADASFDWDPSQFKSSVIVHENQHQET